ncbi:N-terminal GNAT family acetyltransferase [Legionella busanensis]|uniref:N-terminal GNAT family acetyltransferase n=1 Tax=Legionella busanensis TaxID=190655 RepID=A0A378JIE1_9GAMM|nr:GNAT family N-acetyltransferase [Legionella busanensis]STX50103.1 N-terminal GNAT family acetyltransferase [Legionella busanensis]
MLKRNSQLSTTQLEHVNKLALLCAIQDGGLPTLYQDILIKKRETESNILLYENDKLIGFLALYFFYEHACEASLLIDPAYRNQRIATKLFTQIMSLLKQKNMNDIIISFPASAALPWLEASGFNYHHSEYGMIRHSDELLSINNPRLFIRKAALADLNDLCAIDASCFSVHQNMTERFTLLLNDNKNTILLALKNKTPIGKAHIQWKPDIAHFSDIAILPSYQRKGLGSELLAHCINEALSKGRITIDLSVEASNQKALKLYQKYHFKVQEKQDYWAISVVKLQNLLPSLLY